MKRRTFLTTAGLGAGVVAAGVATAGLMPDAAPDAPPSRRRFRHSVCRWPFKSMPLPELARAAARLGIESVELLEPEEWPVVQRLGLGCAVGYATVPDPGRRLTHGWNRVEHHAWLLPAYRRALPLAAAAGVPNLVCFSGNRDGVDDEVGLERCARGLRALMRDAERHRVTVIMELLNSRVDHPGYQCDRTAWGAELVRRVGSERFKLLYDIYHMQIMEGDVIRTIQSNGDAIAHYHTAGVPGRHEIDGGQELSYPAIMRAIAGTGFTGFVAQEFTPTRAPLRSLAEAVRTCSV
jgi:hydroxypyruvate isomerase